MNDTDERRRKSSPRRGPCWGPLLVGRLERARRGEKEITARRVTFGSFVGIVSLVVPHIHYVIVIFGFASVVIALVYLFVMQEKGLGTPAAIRHKGHTAPQPLIHTNLPTMNYSTKLTHHLKNRPPVPGGQRHSPTSTRTQPTHGAIFEKKYSLLLLLLLRRRRLLLLLPPHHLGQHGAGRGGEDGGRVAARAPARVEEDLAAARVLRLVAQQVLEACHLAVGPRAVRGQNLSGRVKVGGGGGVCV